MLSSLYDYANLIFIGMVTSMMLYNAIKFLQLRNKTYLYYMAYMLFLMIYFSRSFLINQGLLNSKEHTFIFSSIVPMMAYFCYYGFAILFLELDNTMRKLKHFFKAMQLGVLAFVVLFLLSVLVFDNFELGIILHDLTRIVLITASIYAITYTYQQRQKLTNYFATGSLFLTLGGTTAFILSTLQHKGNLPNNFLASPLLYFMIGIIVELLCFSLGLSYKEFLRNAEKRNVEESLIRERAQAEVLRVTAVMATREQERNRIAKELHDDLGSGLTEIKLLCEIYKKKGINNNNEIEKIAASSGALIDKLSEIVWATNPRHDTLNSLLVYIRQYAFNFLDNANIKCHANTVEVPAVPLTSEFRRNVFLTIKEALNNVVKYASTDKVELKIEIQLPENGTSNASLLIHIIDFGKGFQNQKLNETTNGLYNMKERMESISGKFEVDLTNGVHIKLTAPLLF